MTKKCYYVTFMTYLEQMSLIVLLPSLMTWTWLFCCFFHRWIYSFQEVMRNNVSQTLVYPEELLVITIRTNRITDYRRSNCICSSNTITFLLADLHLQRETSSIKKTHEIKNTDSRVNRSKRSKLSYRGMVSSPVFTRWEEGVNTFYQFCGRESLRIFFGGGGIDGQGVVNFWRGGSAFFRDSNYTFYFTTFIWLAI